MGNLALVGESLRDEPKSIGQLQYEHNAAAQAKRLNAAARCMTAYQRGLLTLNKLRQNGNQRITVQYVNVSNGSQAVSAML
jgi:hypothetical protein